MSEIAAIVEGETEQRFVEAVLGPHLGAAGLGIWARLPGRVRRGGVKPWQTVKTDILRTMRERPGRACTTMFDFYGLSNDWPGRIHAAQLRGTLRAEHVEQQLLDDIAGTAGADFRREWFVPYIQLHEFEALVFAGLSEAASVLGPEGRASGTTGEASLAEVLDRFREAEAIDDGAETAPSKRLLKAYPAYRKPLHGPLITQRVGLQKLREECPHFGSWVTRLERFLPTSGGQLR